MILAFAVLLLTGAPPPALSPDGVELLGWTPDGAKVVAIEHGVYDGKGTPWARATFFDTAKRAVIGKPLAVELEGDATEAAAVDAVKKLAEAERVRLKLPALVAGVKIATGEKGELTGPDGSPIGDLKITVKKAGKKQSVRECNEPFRAELLTVQLFIMGGEEPITMLAEKKAPAARACSSGCMAGATYGLGKGALFVLKCSVQGFEGGATQPFLVPVGKLQYPLWQDIPAE
jgi:predicted secreted protein